MRPRTLATMLRVGFVDAVAYRAELIVWMLTMTMPLVSLALWSAVAEGGPVGRFGQREFVAYFLAVLVVRQTTGSWVVWEMTQEMKAGTLALRLLKPVHPLVAYAAENVGALPMRALAALPLVVVALASESRRAITHDPVLLAVFVVSLALALALNFATMAAIGALGFWIESAAGIFEIWFGCSLLLSGYLIPLDLYPRWADAMTRFLPFRYALAFPVDALLGAISRREALASLGVEAAFVVVTLFGAFVVWKRGARRYGVFGG